MCIAMSDRMEKTSVQVQPSLGKIASSMAAGHLGSTEYKHMESLLVNYAEFLTQPSEWWWCREDGRDLADRLCGENRRTCNIMDCTRGVCVRGNKPFLPGSGVHYWEIEMGGSEIKQNLCCDYQIGLAEYHSSRWRTWAACGCGSVSYPSLVNVRSNYYSDFIPNGFLYDSNRGRLFLFHDYEFCGVFTRLPPAPLFPHVYFAGPRSVTVKSQCCETRNLMSACRNAIMKRWKPREIERFLLPRCVIAYLNNDDMYRNSGYFQCNYDVAQYPFYFNLKDYHIGQRAHC